MSVELGPGLISTIYDGIQRPLEKIYEVAGANITSKTSASNSVPSQALADIKRAFNNGVCWWEVLANVGNYDLANAPTN